jgi:zinc finger BED domain-containing protein 1 (E3 SUMO-protein ligase ZBED1)
MQSSIFRSTKKSVAILKFLWKGSSQSLQIQPFKITAVLEPFKQVQLLMEGEKYVISSLIPGLIMEIRKGLEEIQSNEDNLLCVKELGAKILVKFQAEYGSGELAKVFHEHENLEPGNRLKGFPLKIMMNAALDPRTKMLTGIPKGYDRNKVWGSVREALFDSWKKEEEQRNINAPYNGDIRPNRAATDDFDPWAEEENSNSKSAPEEFSDHTEIYRRIDFEISEYKKVPRLDMRETNSDGSKGDFTNPLQWWKFRGVKYPLLRKLARKMLCIPATSAPSERVFSVAGLTISKLRTKLKPDNASCLVFLKENWKLSKILHAKVKVAASEAAARPFGNLT